jgi:hypothetical protein
VGAIHEVARMRPEQRIVVSAPLDELWDERGPIAATRGRALGLQEIAALLSSEAIDFVVANVGSPLRWLPVDDRFTFWKGEVKVRLVPADAEKFHPEDYPGEYCYVATQWRRSPEQSTIILLECHH